ncbi:MAG TPA: serine hydrolase, partial [Thermoanaerobaculia bacterium]
MGRLASGLLAAVLYASPASGSGALPVVTPASVGMSAARLSRIDAPIDGAIARKELPGAVVLIGRGNKVVFRKAYGFRSLVPGREAMTADTAFDLASVTKVVATATSVMVLVEEGRVRLSDPVVKHLPEFGREGGREKVTVEQLLVHRGGLVADDPMDLYRGTREEILARKAKVPLAHPPGQRFLYSDAGYEALGELVARVSGRPLDVFARENVFAKLGMRDTEFRPAGEGSLPLARIAPTEKVDGRVLRGEVHDPRARAVGGVAGHAGLFGTADDLARFCSAILAGGKPVLSPAGVAEMTRPRFFGDGDLRALGWDVETSYSSNRGDLLPRGSFGHTGWTGTSIWIDPATRVFVVLLASRVHPDGSGPSPIGLRGIVATLAAAAVSDADVAKLREASAVTALLSAAGKRVSPPASPAVPLPAAAAPVRVGIDVLEADGFKAIAGMKVALLTNPTGRTADGRTAAAVLLSEPARKAGVSLVRLFSPEHGPDGTRDEKVPDQTDPATGLPVRSLYGESGESRR